MQLERTDEQAALAATVRSVLATHAPITPYVRSIADGGSWEPDAAWDELVALGATALLVPEDRGGLGLGLTEAVIVAEELGRACYPGPLLAHLAATHAAALAGVTLAPGSIASLAAEGRSATLSCQRTKVVVVLEAGRLVRAEGVVAEPVEGIDRTVPLARLSWADVTDLGALDADAATDAFTVLVAADALGAATALMEVAVQHAKDRHQFGRPIGAFQAVAHLCVDMLETVELARSGVLHAAWALDVGDPDAHLAALRCRAFGDRLVAVAETAVQVLGGIGYTWEHDAHLWYKRLLTWSTFGGRPATARIALGRALLTGR